ncbi:MAG: cellulase family glycosylhydrolase [Candidatus Omnitrophica bacterium]|nr:cellulase family glycosylhydrolase [Candidatus Omnitrophota bacterium]
MKKLVGVLVLALLLLCPRSGWAASDLKKGLILYYPFDADGGGTVADGSGQGHAGTVNGATFAADGRFGGAYYFNGIDNYIMAGDLGYHPAGTISFWMKAETVENWRNAFTTAFADWDACIRFEEDSSGKLNVGALGMGQGGWYTNALGANRWYHVVYSWDDKSAYGYLDGALVFKNPHPDAASKVHPDLPLTAGEYRAMTLNLRNVAIGNGYSGEASRFWKGWIDEVRVYDRALSTDEVLKLYRNNEDALVLYYSFDTAPQNGVVADESGNGNNGQINGGALYQSNGGKWKGAMEFNGTDASIFVPKADSLNVGQELTFAAWYKAADRSQSEPDPSNRQNPILEYYSTDLVKSGAHMWTDTTGYQWQGQGTGANLVDVEGQEDGYVINTADQTKDVWHHLVVTYDGKTGVGRVYVDGTLRSERQMGVFTPQTGFDLYLGRNPNSNPFMKGLLDEVRIYRRPLSEQEVRALYDSYTLGKVYQNFENNNGSSQYGWAINGATAARSTTHYSGTYSWKVNFTSGWGGAGIPSQTDTWHFNAQPERHDRLTFWVLAKPGVVNANTSVRVRFFDQSAGLYHTDGFELTATKKAVYKKWTQLSVLFSQLPGNLDIKNLDKLQFVFVNEADTDGAPGTYYIDDIQIESQDRQYEDFEPWSCSSTNPGDCGWAWNGSINVVTDQKYSGTQSWKLTGAGIWNGTGLKSQEKRCAYPTETCPWQDYWSVDLVPGHAVPATADRLTFWVKQLGASGMANNVEVKLFDHGAYGNDTPGAKVWTKKSADYSGWTRLTIPVADLKANFPLLNLSDINRVEFSLYWPGEYYFDDVRMAKGQEITIAPDYLSSGVVAWTPVVGAANYTLQESTRGPTGPWTAIYSGPNTVFTQSRLTQSWLRVRWETATDATLNLVPFYSDWSDTAYYLPRPVLLVNQSLQQYGFLEWSYIPQANSYLIQSGTSKTGPWSTVYQGGYHIPPSLSATMGKWYRIRGQKVDTTGKVTEFTSWSPALLYNPSNFIRAVGKTLKDRNGVGSVVKLHGFNLGNYLLLEPWMLGMTWTLERQAFEEAGLDYDSIVPVLLAQGYAETGADQRVRVRYNVSGLSQQFRSQFPDFTEEQFKKIDTIMRPDDWRIRQSLGDRAKSVLETFRNAYIQDVDLDNIMNMGANFIRLPLYYRDIRDIDDATGQWVEGSDYDFAALDRLLGLCADRGISVLLDLHGAPGGQSGEFHTGRIGYNKLFAQDGLGQQYRQRTRELWQAIARHYRTNTTVMGYDLLNEPVGFQSYATSPTDYTLLRNLYNDLYHAVRDADKAADANHVVVMEGAWNWDSLPNPSQVAWKNVMYQFHYYCWAPAEGQTPVMGEQCPAEPAATQIAYQKAFIDAHLANSLQSAYNVPVLIGEFNGFSQKEVWQYYMQKFNDKGYSWSVWSYKNHDHASSWGVYDHLRYDDILPDFQHDSPADLDRKLNKYDTLRHHVPHGSLLNIIKEYL